MNEELKQAIEEGLKTPEQEIYHLTKRMIVVEDLLKTANSSAIMALATLSKLTDRVKTLEDARLRQIELNQRWSLTEDFKSKNKSKSIFNIFK